MKKKILLFLALSMISLLTKAQAYELKGCLIDSTAQSKIENGYVSIINKYDSIITSALTNQDGCFILKMTQYQSNLKVLISYMGYKSKSIPFILADNKKIELGTIRLNTESKNLKEAVVVGKTKYMEKKFDRQVYNMSDNKTTSANSIFDLLRTLPGVVVDQQGNIRYKGGEATILVDEHPATLMYPKIEMIPVALVKKIELVDVTLYNGVEGKGGIINIVMKPVPFDGLSGLVSTTGGTTSINEIDKFDGFANINYKIKQVTLFNNFNYDYNYAYTHQNTNGTVDYGSLYSVDNTLNSYTNNNSFFNYTGAKIEIGKSTKIIISGGFSGDNNKRKGDYSAIQSNLTTAIPFDLYSTTSLSKPYFNSKGIGMSFYHTFPKARKLFATLEYRSEINHSDAPTTYNFKYLNANAIDSTTVRNSNNTQVRNELGYTITYTNPVNEHFQWNTGMSGNSLVKQTNDIKNSIDGILNLPLSNYTEGNKQSFDLYLKMGLNYAKWKIRGGISMQYYHEAADFKRYQLNNQDTIIHLNKVFLNLKPSCSITYVIDTLQEIKLSYNRTVDFPFYMQMCNFVDKSNLRNWFKGNSELMPISKHNIYLGYTYNTSVLNLSGEAFMNLSNNEIMIATYPVLSTEYMNTPVNVASKIALGIDLSAWVMINKNIDFTLSSSLSKTSINAESLVSKLGGALLNVSDLKKENFGFNIQFNSNITINPTLSGMMYVNYFSREISIDGYIFDYINSSISLTQKFLQNKLIFTFGIRNPFDDFIKHGNYINYLGIDQTTIDNSINYKRNFFITLQYKFRQGDRGTKDYKVGK